MHSDRVSAALAATLALSLTASAASAQAQVDVTRLQMLVFTLVSAAFVALKVVSRYEIPEIPMNFQLLMGVSNGIYVAGRSLPSLTETGVPS